ncbi:MAG TPA: NADH-quinone oxidoreductase subunit C [Dissulfurispiraceae bacterium]|nr:NADH-quinone oxidoreductase subunit C [Dissulfurispiraceae bacterium]
MLAQEIADILQKQFSSEVLRTVQFRDQVTVLVKKKRIVEILSFLHDSPDLFFDYLIDLSGVDYLDRKEHRFEVAYNLLSVKHNHHIRINAVVPEDDCNIDSVTGIWAGADWHERECYDLFGIKFTGHHDLRRVLMPEDWEGHPLRKDYPLKSDLGEKEWKGYTDVVAAAERNRIYEVH